MLIQELEQKTGLDRPTIRYYEKEGLICPTRAENGYRQYADSDVENLLRIKLMRQLGISIGKIKDLQYGAEDFSAVISAQIVVLKSQIERDIFLYFLYFFLVFTNKQLTFLIIPFLMLPRSSAD